jgi:hypothetical protein
MSITEKPQTPSDAKSVDVCGFAPRSYVPGASKFAQKFVLHNPRWDWREEKFARPISASSMRPRHFFLEI